MEVTIRPSPRRPKHRFHTIGYIDREALTIGFWFTKEEVALIYTVNRTVLRYCRTSKLRERGIGVDLMYDLIADTTGRNLVGPANNERRLSEPSMCVK